MRAASALSAWFTLSACESAQECPQGTYPLADGGCAPLDQAGDDDPGDDDDDSDTDSTPPGDDDTDEPDVEMGDPCHDDTECESSGMFCVFENDGDPLGICTSTCATWMNCFDVFWSCCDILYGGSACIPDSWAEGAPEGVCD